PGNRDDSCRDAGHESCSSGCPECGTGQHWRESASAVSCDVEHEPGRCWLTGGDGGGTDPESRGRALALTAVQLGETRGQAEANVGGRGERTDFWEEAGADSGERVTAHCGVSRETVGPPWQSRRPPIYRSIRFTRTRRAFSGRSDWWCSIRPKGWA